MNATMKTMLVAVLVGLGMIVGVIPAAADAGDVSNEQYRDTMWYFVPTIGRWSSELDKAVDIAQVKPEQVCSTTLPQLAYRGQGMIDDLKGTMAPADLNETHVQLIGTVEELTAIAHMSCDDPSGAAEGMEFETKRLQRQRQIILTWILASAQPIIVDPIQSVVGN